MRNALLAIAAAFLSAGAIVKPTVESVPSPNYNSRSGTDIDSIVLHTTEGSYSGSLSWMTNPDSDVSAHYLIRSDGHIAQLVADSNRAWHATYYNSRSIGIEMAGYAGQSSTWTTANIAALVDLTAWLSVQYNVPVVRPAGDAYDYPNDQLNAPGFVAHAQVQPWDRTDPGPYFPWTSFLGQVQQKIAASNAVYTFANFEGGNLANFNLAPGYSGSTQGINATASANTAVQGGAFEGSWSQRLTIIDNPAVNNTSENPTGGWFVRHLSGSAASRSQNEPRPTDGYVGFWAKTTTPGVSVSLAIDNTNNVTADRGLRKSMIADGHWHLYEWNLDQNSQWEGWFQGDGLINTSDFTLDSLMFFGPTANATIDIDSIMHNTGGSLHSLFNLLTGDTNNDGIVNAFDLANVKQNFGTTDSPVLGDANFDGRVDIVDYNLVKANFGHTGTITPVPEPATAAMALMCAVFSARCCRRLRREW
jgi:N-acetyl-anhydromuramyl-L-alanine amidase AmpD